MITLLPLIVGVVTICLYQWRRGIKDEEWALIAAGLFLGMGLTSPDFISLFGATVSWAYREFQNMGLIGFMLVFGGLTLLMIWAFK